MDQRYSFVQLTLSLGFFCSEMFCSIIKFSDITISLHMVGFIVLRRYFSSFSFNFLFHVFKSDKYSSAEYNLSLIPLSVSSKEFFQI